jgi:O-antigen ligase
MIAIALIPLILWLIRYGTVFPPDWRTKTFGYCLILACLLIPVGTQARTGLICIGVLAVIMLRDVKRRLLYLGLMGAMGLAAVPFLPSSFTERMGTISTYQADNSAATRLAVWGWTWDYVQDNPTGGGFEAYRLNQIQVATVSTSGSGNVGSVQGAVQIDSGRAWHSAYFEMLGEQGFPGLILFILIHGAGLVRMEVLRRRYLRKEGEHSWVSPLATALQSFQIIYLVGALFVAIAFQPFVLMIIACQVGFDCHVRRMERAGQSAGRPFAAPALRQPVPSRA